MAEHMGMDREAQLRLGPRTRDNLAKGRVRHGPFALRDEDIRRVRILPRQLAEGAEFDPIQGVRAWQPILPTTDVEQAVPEVDLVPAQRKQFPPRAVRDDRPTGSWWHRGVHADRGV
jgi:hypothetical protein